jgi:hypothetical protein
MKCTLKMMILTSNSHDWNWGTIIIRIRLSLYEHGIAESLAECFGYSIDDAQGLIVKYIKVTRLLGGYDTCLDHAVRLHNANKVGIYLSKPMVITNQGSSSQ